MSDHHNTPSTNPPSQLSPIKPRQRFYVQGANYEHFFVSNPQGEVYVTPDGNYGKQMCDVLCIGLKGNRSPEECSSEEVAVMHSILVNTYNNHYVKQIPWQ